MDKLLWLFILISPLFRGLYFYHEAYFAGAALLIVLIMILRKKDIRIEYSINHLLILLYCLLYGLTVFYAVDSGMAFMGFLKVLVIYLFYLVVMQFDIEKNKIYYYRMIVYSGCFMAFIGLLGFFIPSLGDDVIQKGRLGSLLQYPNTFGLYILVGILLLYYLKPFTKLHFLASILMWASIILTYSRSMYLISIIGIILFAAYYRDKVKWIIPTFVIGIILGYFIMVYSQSFDLFKRIEETSLSVSEWQTRLLYYKDGLSIIKNHPFGTGHLGYYYLQRMYQTGSMYFVKYIHSNIMQILMDIGLVGALTAVLYVGINFFSRRLVFIEKLVLCIIIGHGLIDFDFQFPIITLILVLIIGIREDKIKLYKSGKKSKLILISMIFIYIAMGISSYFSYIGEYDCALSIYPWNTQGKVKLLTKNDNIQSEEKIKLAKDIIKQNKFVLDAYTVLRDEAYENKNYEQAVKLSEHIITINPLDIEHVEKYSDILLSAIKQALMVNDLEEGRVYLDKSFEIPYYIDELRKEKSTNLNVDHVPELMVTSKIKQNILEADKLINNMR